MLFYVYVHTTPDGKKYVGQCKNLLNRWSNGDGYIGNDYFYSAIKKHGWDNIKHEIVKQCESETDARAYEAMLIFFLDSENAEKGYNRTSYKSDILKSYLERKELDKYEPRKPLYTYSGFFENSGMPVSKCKELIDQWVFNKTHREMCHDKLIDGMTYVELSKKYGTSVRQIKAIISGLCDMLREHFD